MEKRSDRPFKAGPRKSGPRKPGPGKPGSGKPGFGKPGPGQGRPPRNREDGPGGKPRRPRDDGDKGPRQRDDQEERPAKALPPLSTMPGVEARRAVLEILDRVQEGATLDDAIARTRPFEHLEGPDRAFARLLATETLRRRGAIDHMIGNWLERPLPKKNARVMDILRIAAAQLLVLETPPHAAAATSVELAKERRETAGYASLINAISRKIADAGKDAFDKIPARADTPSWMWRAWERAYGPVGVKAISEAHRAVPPVDLSFKPGEDKARWIAQFREHDIDVSELPTGGLRLRRTGDVSALPGFDEGAWWVQDVAASLPVLLLGDVSGKTVYDLCAAPGGKTLQLASAGANVTAVDKSSARLQRVEENLQRTKLQAKVIEDDALRFKPVEKADAILLDAPCTATGTIRRHPDIPWSKGETALAALVELQSKMIDHALSLLKPGGFLVYCVCSLQREEGERQAKAALARHKNIERVPASPDEVGGIEKALNRDGDLRTLPSLMTAEGGMDGFFAARFRLIA